jgi:hypothetical protein
LNAAETMIRSIIPLALLAPPPGGRRLPKGPLRGGWIPATAA